MNASLVTILALTVLSQVIAPSSEPAITGVHVGFNNTYKVGYWTPVVVDVTAGSESLRGTIEAIVRDSDGVAVRIAASQTVDLEPSQTTSVSMYVFPGRMNSPILVELASTDGSTIHERKADAVALRAASRFFLEIGPTSIDLRSGDRNQPVPEADAARRIVHVNDPSTLPKQWFGYDGVDVILLSASDRAWIDRFAADPERLTALETWVELGGKLIVACGEEASQIMAETAPLHSLAPGRFVDVVPLPRATAIEEYSGSSEPLAEPGRPLALPRFAEVQGKIEVFAGRQPADLPIIIRIPRGFGELTFVGLDLDRSPIADWSDRPRLIQAILEMSAESSVAGYSPAAMLTEGHTDVAGALRQQLGRSFTGVTTISFAWVAILVVCYLVLIGPVDYWLNQKLLRRHVLAWVTFPLIVVVACCGAYWLAVDTKGDRLQINQAQIVDFDVATGRARGTVWSAMYSPTHQRFTFDLASEPMAEKLVAAWGLSGRGIGGMQSDLVEDAADSVQYETTAELNQLRNVPIAMWSTKSLRAEWNSRQEAGIETDLRTDANGILNGSIANVSGADWNQSLLLFGRWAYRLGQIRDGASIDLGRGFDPVQLQSALTRDMRITLPGEAGGRTRDVFLASRASLDDLLNLVMFYQAAGGEAFAQLPNHYQSRTDLSSLVALGRAILVARASDAVGRELYVDGKAPDPASLYQTTVVRFVLPVVLADSDL